MKEAFSPNLQGNLIAPVMRDAMVGGVFTLAGSCAARRLQPVKASSNQRRGDAQCLHG
jgi:hypothetical protein